MINNNCRLTLQFHITGVCNLRCRHCYRTPDDVETMSVKNVFDVLNQFVSLAVKYNYKNRIKKKAHINLTGGEPLLHKNIIDILDFIGENRHSFTCGILTNGSPIDDRLIESFMRNRISFVQMSIDGNRETHDALRAPGDYDRTFATAARLHENGIKTMISFTAHEENFSYLAQVAAQCSKCGVTKFWSDRLVPIGSGEGLVPIRKETLFPYLFSLQRARDAQEASLITEVGMDRALQFLVSGETAYACSAGISLITVDEHGSIFPCRRMPIHTGSIFDTTLEEVYFHHKVFQWLRREMIPSECSRCEFKMQCRGGARCQSYAIYGDFHRADPACPLCREER